MTRLLELFRRGKSFSLAVYLRQFVYITGGYEHNRVRPSKKVTIFNISSHRQQKAPSLIRARYLHASVTHGDTLFVFGGLISNCEYSASIECLHLLERLKWYTLVESSELVER